MRAADGGVMASEGAGQRVLLHVGVPSSGTTVLKGTQLERTMALEDEGVLHCGSREEMFLAALDVRRCHKVWGRRRSEAEGAWDRVCGRARRHRGTSMIGHELLGAASERQITAALTMLSGLEVHVVVTARDLAGQAAAEWQEALGHGSRDTFEEFHRRVVAGTSETDDARCFRAAQELPALLDRWSAGVPRARVHLVCCPRPPRGPDCQPGVPEDLYDQLRETSRRWVTEVANAGYTVHGDHDELTPEVHRTRDPQPGHRPAALEKRRNKVRRRLVTAREG
jgi:hypothetical protein